LDSLKKEMSSRQWSPKKFIFGGTPPAAAVAAKSGLFEVVFSGQESLEEVSTFLQGHQKGQKGNEKPRRKATSNPFGENNLSIPLAPLPSPFWLAQS